MTQRSDRPADALPAPATASRSPFHGYFRPEDIAADRWVHLAALVLCAIGIPLLLYIAGGVRRRAVFAACTVYALTLVTQFAFSTALYHLRLPIERRRLRQLDHAAIFMLIAGTYTPFTVTLIHGAWAVVLTTYIWLGALGGAVYKLVRPLQFPGFSTIGYLLVAATGLAGLAPVLRAVEPISLILILLGLAIYVVGAVIRMRRSLPYRNTIWHVMVLTGAACHFGAILHGVALAGG